MKPMKAEIFRVLPMEGDRIRCRVCIQGPTTVTFQLEPDEADKLAAILTRQAEYIRDGNKPTSLNPKPRKIPRKWRRSRS